MKHMNKLVLVGLAVLALPTLGRANLLVGGSFSYPNVVPLATIVHPLVTGIWGQERSVRTGPISGIVPRSGNWMLKMDDDGLHSTQTMQFVYIGFLAGHMLEVEAWFNSDSSAAVAGLRVDYYATVDDFQNSLSGESRSMILNRARSTWQGLNFRSAIPTGANYVGLQVGFPNNSIGRSSGFVDSASLTPVPEPASMLALGIGLAALAARRRRRRK